MIKIMIMIILLSKNKKKSNKETEGFVYLRNMEKNGVIFFVSLHIFDFIVI